MILDKIKNCAAWPILSGGLSIGVIVLDRNYRIIFWNQWMAKNSGIREKDILGQNIFERYPDIKDKKKERHLIDCIERGKHVLLSPLFHQYLIPIALVKDGKEIQMLQNVRIYPVSDAGETFGAVIIIEDWTEAILHEKEISRLNRILRRFREISKLGSKVKSEEELFTGLCKILIKDTGYSFVWIGIVEEGSYDVKPVAFAGIESGPFKKVKVKWDASEYGRGVVGRAIKTGKTQVVSSLQKDPLSNLWPEFSKGAGYRSCCSVPLRVDDRVICAINVYSGMEGVFHEEELGLLEELAADTCLAIKSLREEKRRREAEEARKKLEAQLLHAQKMESIGRLAGGVAHDFNNLLTPIIGSADLMMMSIGKDHELREDIEEIKKAADRAASLTRQLLAFSRRQVLEPKVINLNDVIPDMDKMLRRLIGEDIDLETALAPDLDQVEADPGQIEQVIMNLAVNARDAMPQGGKLTIETANVDLDEAYAHNHVAVTPGPYVMMAISDTGIGMDKETLSRIFEPFFTTKEKGKGTGLGLSTVYGIVKQSGGNTWVYSEPGKGTTFKIYLPRVEKQIEATEDTEAVAESLTGSETILVVEDNEMVRDLAQSILQHYGYDVLEAQDGEEAIKVSKGHDGPIHLMLTDVVMPGMDGNEMAEHITALRPNLKIIYMSGYTENAIVHHGVLDLKTAFIQKPFTPQSLARKVREVLDC